MKNGFRKAFLRKSQWKTTGPCNGAALHTPGRGRRAAAFAASPGAAAPHLPARQSRARGGPYRWRTNLPTAQLGGAGAPPPAPPAPKTAAPCGAAVFGVVPCLTARNSPVLIVIVHLCVLEIVEVVVVVLVKIPCVYIVAGVVGIVVRRTGRGMVSLERRFCC